MEHFSYSLQCIQHFCLLQRMLSLQRCSLRGCWPDTYSVLLLSHCHGGEWCPSRVQPCGSWLASSSSQDGRILYRLVPLERRQITSFRSGTFCCQSMGSFSILDTGDNRYSPNYSSKIKRGDKYMQTKNNRPSARIKCQVRQVGPHCG